METHPPSGQALLLLTAAIRRCTRAQRVSYWRCVHAPGESYFAREPGAGSLRPEAFLNRILVHGWARLEASESGGFEARQLAAIGLVGEVIGVACSPTPRVNLLLAGAPVSGTFSPLDPATIRLLSRLMHSQDGLHLATLSASA